jgi:acetyl-CoA acetyltransferase
VIKPLVKYVASAVHGLEPDIMGLGPIGATRKALTRAGVDIKQLDLVELNEAFASRALQCIRELDVPMEKLL